MERISFVYFGEFPQRISEVYMFISHGDLGLSALKNKINLTFQKKKVLSELFYHTYVVNGQQDKVTSIQWIVHSASVNLLKMNL